MIGCKVMRTLASVEFEIILILGLPCCLSSSVRCHETVMEINPDSDCGIFDVESSHCLSVVHEFLRVLSGNDAVPVPLLEDPYEAIRQAYLVRMDTESEPFEDPVETETPESPHTVAPPTSLLDSTPPTLVPIPRRTARMAVYVPPAMTPSLSASIAELVEDDDEEKDNEEEDKEIEVSLDSDSGNEDAKDEGPTVEDEDPAAGTRVLLQGTRALQRAAPVMETAMGEPLRLGYGALRHQEITLGEGRMPSVFEVGQSSRSVPESERPERVSALRQPTHTTWIGPEDGITYIDVPAYPPPALPAQRPSSPERSSSSLLVSLAPSIVPSPISSPVIPLTAPSLVASPATAESKGFLTELGAQVEMQRGLIHDHTIQLGELSPALFERYDRDIGEFFTRSGAVRDEIFSQRYRFRSLEHDDTQRENRELRLQIAEEWCKRLDLAEIVDSMRRGHEPKGDV
ncbi:hypothetical protein Tco_1120875 [Tanacetum coccineum]|uniref:Uncharacterized protein n=1 Tax=Tanacetum coccineum TaxID=301880 RepID=A0ABQ5IXL4_9ASTR